MDKIRKINSMQQAVRQQAIQKQRMQRMLMQQVAASRSMIQARDDAFNMVAMKRQFRPIEENLRHSAKKALSKSSFADEEIEIIEEVKNIEDTAARFNKHNNELNSYTLLILKDSINDEDSIEDILKKVLNFYPDYTLADDALDFLLQTSKGKLAVKMQQAKNYLNSQYKREIVAGRNITFQAQTFSKEGLGSATGLRDMYRDITGNPRTALVLFNELSAKFSYDKLRTVIRFLLHSLGTELKSKGPSIPKGELARIINDIQIMQAISGVYRFFMSREKLVSSQFEHFGLIQPKIINFETLSKMFINILKERYVTPERILFLSKSLGLTQEFLAQIIILSQMRDATRNTSKRLYKSDKFRQEVLGAFIEALEELEENLEEEADE